MAIRVLLSPSGNVITTISSYSFAGEDASVDVDGQLTGDGFDDFPSRSAWTWGEDMLVMDRDGVEYLQSHCRLIWVDDDFDRWDHAMEQTLHSHAWPEDIRRMCAKAAHYAGGALLLEMGMRWCPQEMRDDPTIKAVMDNILLGRAKGMVESLCAQVAAWRKDNPDVTTLIEDDDELLALADAKHDAQMADMEAPDAEA